MYGQVLETHTYEEAVVEQKEKKTKIGKAQIIRKRHDLKYSRTYGKSNTLYNIFFTNKS